VGSQLSGSYSCRKKSVFNFRLSRTTRARRQLALTNGAFKET